MPPLTRRAARETIRNLTVLLGMLLLGGCATHGPLHVYSVASSQPDTASDVGPDGTDNLPVFLRSGQKLTGLAYDPFTDHLFLRLAPGNRIRVIDRPARKIKREFTIAHLPATGGGDMAVRPRDGHLFLAHPTEPALIETTRHGEFVRRIQLDQLSTPAAGVAYDSANDRLLVLSAGAEMPVVTIHDLNGKNLSRILLQSDGAHLGLAFDSVKREIFVPEGREAVIAIFDELGKLRRTIPAPGNAVIQFLDVGERSFVRVF